VTVTNRRAIRDLGVLRADDLIQLGLHHLAQHPKADTNAERQQPILRRAGQLPQRVLHPQRQNPPRACVLLPLYGLQGGSSRLYGLIRTRHAPNGTRQGERTATYELLHATGQPPRERSEVKTGKGPPPLTAEGVVGAVFNVLHARMIEPDGRPVVELLNPLMAIVVLPYLGQAAATRELQRPIAKMRRAAPQRVRSPLDDLDTRITYRTLRVLSAVAAQPGGSNREVADRAGIADAGQSSKLLTRLEGVGLIHNSGDGRAKGERNAWTLTAKGEELQRSVGVQAEG
jgi:predicted transcriptional regulator